MRENRKERQGTKEAEKEGQSNEHPDAIIYTSIDARKVHFPKFYKDMFLDVQN